MDARKEEVVVIVGWLDEKYLSDLNGEAWHAFFENFELEQKSGKFLCYLGKENHGKTTRVIKW